MSKQHYIEQNPSLEERLHYFTSIDSTNILGKELSRQGKIGHVVIAETQTAGRGRLQRNFSSPADWGLYLSYILPHMPVLHATSTIYCGAIVANVLEGLYGDGFGIKWVNDVLLHEKKICGILAESTHEGIVMGIGINLNTPAEFFGEALPNASSVGAILDKNCIVADVGLALIAALDEFCAFAGDTAYQEQLFASYRKKLLTLGREVRVISSHETFEGIAKELMPDGSLLVVTAQGDRMVSFGDVSVRGLKGYL